MVVQSAKPFVAFITHAFEAKVSDVVPCPSDSERVLHAEARTGTVVRCFAA